MSVTPGLVPAHSRVVTRRSELMLAGSLIGLALLAAVAVAVSVASGRPALVVCAVGALAACLAVGALLFTGAPTGSR